MAKSQLAVFLCFTGCFLCWLLVSACNRESTNQHEALPGVGTDTVSVVMMDSISPDFIDYDTLYKYYDTIMADGEVFFLSQGDIPVSQDEFARQLFEEISHGVVEQVSQVFTKKNQQLVIGYDPSKDDTIRWKQFPIRFAIMRSSFRSIPNSYETIRGNLLQAIKDWKGVCGVDFTYVDSADNVTNPDSFNLDFKVIYKEPVKRLPDPAIAFYPNAPKSLRELRVLPEYWITTKDKVGVFRHEIGHILGFRHEHAAYINIAPLECRQYFKEVSAPTRPVTFRYDSKSVMHYMCGGAGSLKMEFSKNDSVGFVSIYGKN